MKTNPPTSPAESDTPTPDCPRRIVFVGGGTVEHIHPHLALSAVAYGRTARTLNELAADPDGPAANMSRQVIFTTMALGGGSFGNPIETPEDLRNLAKRLVEDSTVRIVFWSPAVVDFTCPEATGKYGTRLSSSGPQTLELVPVPKILPIFRILPNSRGVVRKDIFLVAFKTTAHATPERMYAAGLRLLKESSANLVLVNDVVTRLNMVVTPEEAAYHITQDREAALKGLLEMALLRSHLTFTRSTVVAGERVPWSSDLVPASLRAVVDHAVQRGAYKRFQGKTVGHFAVSLGNNEFLTSVRKSDFNSLDEVGLVRIRTDGPDTVVAYGAKPSVGGQSQRQVFHDHPDLACIFHAHVPLRPDHPDAIPVVSQREFECGSLECGENTSRGLATFGNLKAVMLDNHGPNIVFPKDIDPKEVIDFIERNFDLTQKTGGFALPTEPKP